MKDMRLLVFVSAAILLCLPGLARGLSVGMAPPVIDAGEMLPGESKSMSFYLMTDQDRDVLVDISTKRFQREFFNPKKARHRYRFVAEEASEEDASGWITLFEDSVILPPEKRLFYIEGGGLTKANKKVDFIITVPEDAEPGYHAGLISPYPRTSSQGKGTTLGIISVVEMGYVVNVLGDARRDAGVVGISFRKDSPEQGILSVLVKNLGTVSLSARAYQVRVFDSDNKTVAEGESSVRYIKPGRVERLDIPMDARGMGGEYGVTADVEWITGKGSVEGSIDVGEYVPPPPAPRLTGEVIGPVPAWLPMWILPLILIFILGLVYWRVK